MTIAEIRELAAKLTAAANTHPKKRPVELPLEIADAIDLLNCFFEEKV